MNTSKFENVIAIASLLHFDVTWHFLKPLRLHDVSSIAHGSILVFTLTTTVHSILEVLSLPVHGTQLDRH